jgi:hypothetical protein
MFWVRLQLVKKVPVSESAIRNEQRQRVTDACTKESENEHSHKSVKFSDMRGEFDSLQHPPPGNPEDFRRVLATGLLKNCVFRQTEAVPRMFWVRLFVLMTVSIGCRGFIQGITRPPMDVTASLRFISVVST